MTVPRVLLVEDDPAVRRYVATVLAGVGCEVVEFPGGAQAVAAIEQSADWALVFTDLEMDGADGVKVLMAAHKHSPKARRVLCTGHPTLAAEIACRSLGAWLIPKPISAEALRALGRSLESL